MKYIRRKDGVYKLKVNKELKAQKVENYFYTKSKHGYNILFDEKDVKKCKQADTIEELCDEFVVAYESGARIVYSDFEWAKVKAKSGDYKFVIYGAIWTEWGLRYVAKINNKGELELL